MRKFDADFYLLKAAMADLVERCGGQKRAADIVGLAQSTISYVCQRDNPAMLSISAKLMLERECGVPVVTKVEAELQGHRIEREGAPLCAGADGPFDAHAAVMVEVGDLCRTFSQAVGDGKYSRTDALTVGKDLADLRRAIERFERVNAATHAGGGA